MQQIELYIDGQRCDLFKDETISLTQTIQNVRDIAKVFTDFSKQFTLPASRINNIIFKHYYNYDIGDGFDGRAKVDALIKLNGADFKKGKIKLLSIDMKNNKPYAYKVSFFGDIINLKDFIKEDKLSDLDFLNNFSILYNPTNVLSYLETGVSKTVGAETFTNVLTIPLLTHTQRLYYDSSDTTVGTGNLYAGDANSHGVEYQQLKPAIRLYAIIKAIENKYSIANGYPNDIKFSDDFFNTSNDDFHELRMWLHRNKGDVFGTEDPPYKATVNTFDTPNSLNGFYVSTSSFSIYDVYNFNTYAGAFYYDTNLDIGCSSTAEFTVILKKNYTEVQRTTLSGATSYNVDFGFLTNGYYTIELESNVVPLTFFASVGALNVTRYAAFGNTSDSFDINSFGLLSDFAFTITNQIPEMKVLDFLTALFKMFNLTAYYEDDEIKIDTLYNYYNTGNDVEISKWVDFNKSNIAPQDVYKKINFKYDGNKTFLADNHNELFNETFGETFYGGGHYDSGQAYEIKVPFEHMKFERLVDANTGTATTAQWGWCIDKINEDGVPQPYIGKPLVFYTVNRTSLTSIRVTNDVSYDDLTQYNIPSNSLDVTDSQTINFKAELNEYTNTVFEDTLYQTYYSNYIPTVFSIVTRVIKLKAYLTLSKILAIKLNDKLVINDKKYKINSLTTNLQTGETDLELITDNTN
jgi:hypothetical protein